MTKLLFLVPGVSQLSVCASENYFTKIRFVVKFTCCKFASAHVFKIIFMQPLDGLMYSIAPESMCSGSSLKLSCTRITGISDSGSPELY